MSINSSATDLATSRGSALRRITAFAERGFPLTQSGRWLDQNAFAFFGTEEATSTVFETYVFPEGFEYPEPEEWFPAPPPKEPSNREQKNVAADEKEELRTGSGDWKGNP